LREFSNSRENTFEGVFNQQKEYIEGVFVTEKQKAAPPRSANERAT
jgi:hypothetical protein